MLLSIPDSLPNPGGSVCEDQSFPQLMQIVDKISGCRRRGNPADQFEIGF